MTTPFGPRWLRQIVLSSPRRARKRPAGFLPRLEPLEDRRIPSVGFSISNASLPEGDSGVNNMTFTVTRTGDLSPSATVQYTTQDGTAHAGVDYVATSGTLSFAVNQTSATIAVPVIGNVIYQSNRSFFVVLSHPSTANVAFAGQIAFPAGSKPNTVVAADLNGDGKLDLVIADRSGLSVLLNNTAAGSSVPSFLPAQTFAGGPTFYTGSVSVGDVNGDGKPDLVVANNSLYGQVSVLVNTTPAGSTTASFGIPQTFSTASYYTRSLTLGDINGDGKLDLAVTSTAGVSVLLNTTPTGATAASFDAAQAFGAGPLLGPAFADINGDGRPDLAAADWVPYYLTTTATVLVNATPNGASSASFNAAQSFQAGAGRPENAAFGDFNGDGKPDLVTADFDYSTAAVLLNTTPTGASAASFAPAQSLNAGSGPTQVQVGDFNGDGKPDLAVADFNGSSVSVLLNATPGGATAPYFIAAQSFGVASNPYSVAVGDFNGDGLPDLATANFNAGSVSVLLNTSAAISGSPATGTIQDDDAPAAIAVAAGNNQSAEVHMPFGTALAVSVTNAAGHLVQGVTVTFTAPASGAGGTFAGGGNSAIAVTNSGGLATAPALTAGTVAGTFQVTAVATGGLNPGTSFTLTNEPGPVDHLKLTGPSSVTAGRPFNLTVTAMDVFDNVTTGFRGTVHFTSSDSAAKLPGNYRFTAADNGKHTFSGTLETAGTQTVTASSVRSPKVKGTASFTVNAAAALLPEPLPEMGDAGGWTDAGPPALLRAWMIDRVFLEGVCVGNQ